jgi:FkbM family methyltransferase
MSLFGAFWDLGHDNDPNEVGVANFGNGRGLFHNIEWSPKGVLHIGAWDAWEAKQYSSFCGSNCVWMEAHPNSFARFKQEVEKYGQKIYNYAAWNVDDLVMDFYCPPSNQDSSSLIEQRGDVIKTNTITVSSLFERENLNFSDYDFLNIDTEGAELQVLEGIGDNIKHFTFIIIEVSDLGSEFDIAINKTLEDKGFTWIKDSKHHISSVNGKSFCDKLYKKIN